MDFSEINIGDKALFDGYFRRFRQQVSELTFTNLFMWRKYYGFRYTEISGMLCIISEPVNGVPFAFVPIGNIEDQVLTEVVYKLKRYFNQNQWLLKFERVEEEYLKYISRFAASEDDISYDRNASDYLYAASDLINLKGKKYDGKRNHINKFKKMYDYRYTDINNEKIDENLIENCFRILDEWCVQRGGGHVIEHEKTANSELLNNFARLSCKAALIEVDGIYEAFTVGEMMNDTTAVIHIEKAKSSINGLYTFINQQFCEREWPHVEFINREQDLGIEGLKKAKLSYNPVRLVNKYGVLVK